MRAAAILVMEICSCLCYTDIPMDSLQASFNIVIPILLMMFFGWFLRWRNIMSAEAFSGMNKFCSSVLIPIVLFYNTYTIDFSQAWNPRLLAFAILSILFLCVAGYFLVPLIEEKPARRSVMVMSLFRSNFIIFAMIIATTLSGDAGAAAVTMLSALVIPLMNLLCIIILEINRAGDIHPGKMLLSLLKNPCLLSVLTGFLLQLLPIKLPILLQSTLRDISHCFSPLSIITLGGLFKISSVKQNAKNLTIALFLRLIAVPAIMLPIALGLGFRGPEFAALISLFIAPAAISTFSMSSAMGGDSDLSGQIVFFSSIFSVLTMFIWIYAMSSWIG